MVTWPLLRMSGVGSWVPLRSGWHSLLGPWVRGVCSPGSLWGERWGGPWVSPRVSGVVIGSPWGVWCGPLALTWGEWCGPLALGVVVWVSGSPGVSGVVSGPSG